VHLARLGELEFRSLPGRTAADPLAGAETRGGVTVRLVRIEPGPRSLHVHEDSVEVIHVAEGRGRHRQGDAEEVVAPGDTLLVPAGVPHATIADEPLLLVCFFPHLEPFATTRELGGETFR
jgi:quercetin dioxygenase-like cupin family protein